MVSIQLRCGEFRVDDDLVVINDLDVFSTFLATASIVSSLSIPIIERQRPASVCTDSAG